MKKNLIPYQLVLLLLLSCGKELNLGDDDSSATPKPTVVPGMVLYFDASFVNGAYGMPTTPCGELHWEDLSGNGNHGTLSNFSCNTSSGWNGTGTPNDPFRLSFDGVGGMIITALDVQPSAMPETTWEGWIRPAETFSSDRQTIFSSDDGGFDRQLLIEVGTDRLAAFVGTAPPNVFQPASVTVGDWQHVAVTYTPTDVIVYKNGTKYSFGSPPSDLATTNTLTLGTNPGFGQVFHGDIAYLTVYDRALSDAEISERCRDLQSRFAGATCN